MRNTDGARTVVALEYDAYPPLCLTEGAAILREALNGVIDARCVHRVGRLAVGDVAVWIGVIAGHRDEAFRACRFIIDEVKRRVPIWKKEHYRDGSSEWIGLGGPGVTGTAASPPAGLRLAGKDEYLRSVLEMHGIEEQPLAAPHETVAFECGHHGWGTAQRRS